MSPNEDRFTAAFPFTLRQLQYFDAIASEGSLAAAAKRCLVSASALTLAIDDLEHHLRLQLLIRRKGKGVMLTPAGTRLLLHVRRVLQYAESLSECARLIRSRRATLATLILTRIS